MVKSTSPRSRKPGRPSDNGNADAARDRLLDAALQCYLRQGIAATTLKAIADAGQVTPALLHYYFGDRDGVLQAVIEQRLMPIFQQLRLPLDGPALPAQQLIPGFVRAVFATVAQVPWLPGLWVREVLSEGGALRRLLGERLGPLLPKVLATQLRAAQQRGELNPALDPELLVVSLIGLTLFPLAAQPVWRGLFDDPAHDHERLLQHTLALVQGLWNSPCHP